MYVMAFYLVTHSFGYGLLNNTLLSILNVVQVDNRFILNVDIIVKY